MVKREARSYVDRYGLKTKATLVDFRKFNYFGRLQKPIDLFIRIS